jgi:hypothetical protein
MRNGSSLLEPEPRRKPLEEETPRVFSSPLLPEFTERRKVPRPRPPVQLLAPPPWPQGQFRIDPEA